MSSAWISGEVDTANLAAEIAALDEIGRVETQTLIFTNYTALERESDSEGQLILYEPAAPRYRFFADDWSGYQPAPDEIKPGEVYVSPSLVSIFGLGLGHEITFPIARSGRDLALTVAGFYEDPIMGSSMIGMKGFLVCESDYRAVLDIIGASGIDALGRAGAMLHIFPAADLPAAQLNMTLNERTSLPEFVEFTHSRAAITGFMLILQNAFSALLLAFVTVLLGAVLAVLGHNISSTIRADYKNMGALKTVGLASGNLRRVLLAQVGLGVLAGFRPNRHRDDRRPGAGSGAAGHRHLQDHRLHGQPAAALFCPALWADRRGGGGRWYHPLRRIERPHRFSRYKAGGHQQLRGGFLLEEHAAAVADCHTAICDFRLPGGGKNQGRDKTRSADKINE